MNIIFSIVLFISILGIVTIGNNILGYDAQHLLNGCELMLLCMTLVEIMDKK